MADQIDERMSHYCTLREAMAWDAMQAILEKELKNPNFVYQFHMEAIARHSVELANAMIAELKRTAPKEDEDSNA